jgi:molecular chaperone Hsp33
VADRLTKGRIEGLEIAFHYAVTTALSNDAVLRHGCDPVAAHILTRALNGALLAASATGDHQRVNIRWAYQGGLRTVLVDAGNDGTVRGLINPTQLSEVDDLSALYGEQGELRVVRSRGGTVVASGTVEACFLDVIDDLTAFFCMSDQVESGAAVLVGFSDDPAQPVQLCRGLLLQALPACDLTLFDRVRERLRHAAVRDLLARVDEDETVLPGLIEALAAEENVSARGVWEAPVEPVFRCTCGPDRMGDAVRCLGYADRVDIVKKQEDVKIRCHFCNEQYVLSVDDCIAAWNAHLPASS